MGCCASKPGVRGGRALIVGDAARGDNSPSSPEHSGEDHDHDEFVDAFDTMDDGWGSDGGGGAGRTPRASVNGTSGGLSLSPVFEQMANSPFHDLTPQEQVKFVERDGGIPYELCRDAWSQERHALRINELVNATKERVAREKNVDRAAANVTKRRMSRDEEDPPEMSMYDQAKGVVGRMQMGQDITKFELPATFLTPFSAIQASEDVLTIIAGTERSDKEWRDMSDTDTCEVEQRFLNVLRLFLDMESLRCEEGTSGGTRSAFTMPPMKKPINSVLGETHRTRVAPHVEMVAEQVSHHPPITCWEVEHALAGLKITGNLSPKPIFHGTSVQVALRGTLLFEFQETGETYLAQIPDLYIRFFGLGGGYNENVGKVRFERVSGGTTGDATKLWADCHFKPRGSAGWKSKAHRMDCTVYREDCVGLVCCDTGNDVSVSSIPGTDSPIAAGAGVVGLGFGFLENFGDKSCATFQSAKAASRKFAAKNFVPEKNTTNVQMLLSLKGHYNSEVRNLVTGELFWQAAKRKRLNPVAATVPIDLETESHLVWGDLIKSIVKEDWKKANLAKKRVEVAQRALMKEIKEGRKKWVPRLFQQGQKTHLGLISGMYTLKPNVRKEPPECDSDWHEMIGKAVFEDL